MFFLISSPSISSSPHHCSYQSFCISLEICATLVAQKVTEGNLMEKGTREGIGIGCKRPHFFDIYSSALSSNRLKVPHKFVKHLEGKTSGLVSLERPSGNFWHVTLIQESGDLLLHEGWPTFVMDHSITSGDLLVFRYNGDLHFTVQVFEQSACEKETAFHATCSQDPSTLEENKAPKRQINEIYEALTKKMKGSTDGSHPLCNGHESDVELDLSTDQYYAREDVVTIAKHESSYLLKEAPYISSAIPSQENCDEKCDIESKVIKREDFDLHILKLTSTAAEKRIAKSFSSSFPCFVRIMKKFNISGSYTLNIPYQFSMEHLPNCRITVVLRNVKGECWTVNSVPTTKVHTAHTFCGGWMAFVRANGIQLEDVCVFELVSNCELRVHIVGGGKDGSTAHDEKNLTATSPEDRESIKIKKRKSVKVSSQVLKKVKKVDKKSLKTSLEVSSKDSKKQTVSKRSTDKKGKAGIDSGRGSQTKDCVSIMLSTHEERVARLFKSSYPTFVRIMKRFNISGSYTLKIPYQFATAHLPPFKTEIVLRNQKEECWFVNSVPDSKGRLSRTFCGGWLSFVRDNDIKIGDTCIFELVGKFEMRVHIEDGNEAGFGT